MVTTSQHDKLMSHVPSKVDLVGSDRSSRKANACQIVHSKLVWSSQSLSFWLGQSEPKILRCLVVNNTTRYLMHWSPQGHQTGFLSPTAGAVAGLLQIWNKMQQLLQSPGLQSHHWACTMHSLEPQQNWNFGNGAPTWHLQICIFCVNILSQNLWFYPDR